LKVQKGFERKEEENESWEEEGAKVA